MASTSLKPIDQETLLAVVREQVKKADGDKGRISMKRFLASSGLRSQDVYRFYPSWNDTLQAAGVEFDPWAAKIDSERLLKDWGGVTRKSKRVTNWKLYHIHGKYDPTTLTKRFSRWSNVSTAFRKFAEGKSEWADVLALVEQERGDGGGGMKEKARRRLVTARQQWEDGVSFGTPISLAALRNAPVNENGVIFLFGALAEKLGFSVEAVRSAFPDCVAKRRMEPDEWRNVRIEFEYESRNFRDHRHDPEGCDLIVCWQHNWPDCPENLEVIALSEEIKRI